MSDGIKSSKKPKKRKYNKENESPAKRKSLTGTQKAEKCHLKQKSVSQVKLAKQFSVAEATISNIIREKNRTAKFLLLEEALALWVSRVTEALQTVTGNSSLTNKSDLIDEIQNLIGQLPLDQPMSAYQYIIADNDLIATEIPTDEEIIKSVKNYECIEPEDESPKKLIFFVQALEFIKGISSFLEQQPDSNFKVKDSFIQGLRQLKKE
ncbi:16735_t:CDS:2, partial [Dentiscutata heterogama]